MMDSLFGTTHRGGDMARVASRNMAERLARSRRRSTHEYHLDVGARGTEQVLSRSELSRLKDCNEHLLRAAVPGIDWLHRQLGDLGYCLLLADCSGATLEMRASDQRAGHFSLAGLREGPAGRSQPRVPVALARPSSTGRRCWSTVTSTT